MLNVLGLTGIKGSGKDTLAQLLVERYGFRRLAFADALYKEVANAYGMTVEQLQVRKTKETPRDRLALINCADAEFVAEILVHLSRTSESKKSVRQILTEPRSPRQILQWWGTEYRRKGRNGIETYWTDKVYRQIVASKEPVVITDVRFPNEAELIGSFGYSQLGRVIADWISVSPEDQTAMHPSEREMLNYPVQVKFHNKWGNPEALIAQAITLMEQEAIEQKVA